LSSIVGHETPEVRRPWEMSLGEFLDGAAGRNPDRIFVEMSGQKLTYRQFQDDVLRAAGMFQSMGVHQGDRVCLFMPNCVEYLYCWFGLALLGAIGVPINTAYKRDESAYILNDSEAKALVAHQSLLPVAREAAALAPGLEHKLVVRDDSPSSSPFDDENPPRSPLY